MKKIYNTQPEITHSSLQRKERSCISGFLLACAFFVLNVTAVFAQDGDTCATAISLDALSSPVNGSTAGHTNTNTPTCNDWGTSPDVYYSITVPLGYKLVIGPSAISYDHIFSLYYGSCATQNAIACIDPPGTTTWENTTGSTQTVYYVQDGWGANNAGTFTLAWTLTPPPTCNVPRSVTATLTSATLANLSWAAPVTGTAQSYEYAVSTSATPPANGTITTDTAITGAAVTVNATNYLHVRTNCGTTDGYSEWVRYSFYSGICVPAPQSVDGRGITNVSLANISNTTVAETGNYGNYTTQIINAGQGVTYPLSVSLATNNNAYTVKVWVDWNDNLTFDTDEEVFTGAAAASFAARLTGNITVPASAATGNHRLRVGAMASWNSAFTPCFTGYGGSFEDYTINVTAAPTCYTPTNLTVENTGAGVATISWTSSSLGTNPAGYEYSVTSTFAAPLTGSPVSGTRFTGITVPVNATSYLHVRTNCGDGNFSDWVTISLYNGVCIPAPTSVNGGGITNVTIGTINNTTVAEAGNYGNYSAQSVNIGQGVTQPFSITFDTYTSYNTRIWVDWNDDLDFDDEGEQLFAGASENRNGAIITGNIVVPATATLGAHRLRIGATSIYNGPTTPCYTGANGAYEDYTINVVAGPSCYAPTAVTGTSVSSGIANISWTAPVLGGTPTGYEYAVTATATPPAAGTANATTSVTNVTVTANAVNYLHVRTNCGDGDFSQWVTSTLYNGYCTPAPSFQGGTGITNVTFGSINNTTNGTLPYVDYSAQSTTLGQGVTQAFSVSVAVYNSYSMKIWVDWNNDLDFDDAGEEVYSGLSTYANTATITGNITVPANAALGNHRMRIGGIPDYNGTVTACYNISLGTFEDYTINVIAPPACYAPTALQGVATASGLANLSWTAPAQGNAPAGYEYVVNTTNTEDPASGTAITDAFVNGYTGMVDNTIYYLHVRTKCGDGFYSDWTTSFGFRFLAGETCSTAIDLATLTSPYSSTTVGASNDYEPECGFLAINSSNDLYYSIVVPNGYTLTIGQTENNYLTVHSIFYGGCDAASQTSIACLAYDDALNVTSWENVTGSSQTVYYIQDGWGSNNGTFTLEWLLAPPLTCDVPRALDVNLTSLTSTNISWNVPNTGTPVGYEYAVTQSATPPVTGITYTTALSATNIAVPANTNNYLHVRTVCSETDGNSFWVRLPFYSGYCVPTNTGAATHYITSISTTGAQTNLSNTSEAPAAYSDFTATQGVSIYAGGSFAVQATAANATTDYLYGIWVDWNNDFEFSDNEKVLTSLFLLSPATLGTVTIPANTPVGNYRMRVRNAASATAVNPCGDQLGEAEDYILTVTATPTCVAPFALTVAPSDVTTANLSWTAPLLGQAPAGYEYVFGPSATAPAGNGTPTTALFIFDEVYNPAVSNYLFVRSTCGEGEYSEWVSTAVLSTDTPQLTANSVMVFKDGSAINISSGSTLMTGVTIYDTRGRKLYSEANINATQTAITGMQIQQQVIIVEVTTAKGKVSKRIVF